jgi:hypothetical protein
MSTWIDEKLNDFFDKNSGKYLNNDIFSQIYSKLMEYEQTDPDLYHTQLKRIRDLQNCVAYARKDGFMAGIRQGMRAEITERVKKILKEGYKGEDFIDNLYFSKSEIKELIQEVPKCRTNQA